MHSQKRNAISCAAGIVGISVFCTFSAPARAQSSVTINVDANLNRRAIDPRIYGVNFATTSALSDLNVVLHRNGGNHTSRYNWKQNADNKGNDWYYESIADSDTTQAGRLNTFITDTRNAMVGAEPMITIPMIGYVAKVAPDRSKLASFSIRKYGAQTGSDWQWFPDAGNGISAATNRPITGNDPLDANVPADSTFQQDMVKQFVSRFGLSKNGGVKYYLYDNEHSIWHNTHRDVKPVGANMEEIRNKIIEYGTKIRAVDPDALLVGPEEWGWSGYLYSGYDLWYCSKNGWATQPDKAAHGNWDYLPWLLDQLRKHEQTTGKRVLDIFSVHIYPQGGEFSADTSSTMQLRRNRSTRSLWDPNYVDESWIATQVKLIPRMKGWIAQYYRGLKTGITEYSWGAENHINGATTQADILGIFGREGLDLATRWVSPDPSTPTYKAIKMYRNYDGRKSTFGETSVQATVANPDTVAAFAATRAADGALTVMAINKQLSTSAALRVNLANFTASASAQVYQLTSANVITRLSDVAVSGGAIQTTVPAQSITLFVVPAGSQVQTPITTSASASPSTLNRGTRTQITVNVKNGTTPLTGALVDLEVYNSSGQKVFQQFTANQNFTAGQTRSYSWNWTPTTAGTYTIRVGIFSGNWSTLFHWNSNAGTITVR